MKQSLQLKLSQQLTLTPQLQQSIRLLQLSTVELQQEIEQFLLQNPMLERVDEYEAPSDIEPAHPPHDAVNEPSDTNHDSPKEDLSETHLELDYGGDWGNSSGLPRDEDEDFDPHGRLCHEPTLREHLLSQLVEHVLSARDRAIVTLLIEALNEQGYLEDSLDHLAAELSEELATEADELLGELQVGLSLLQQFEPAGVGARNLHESMRLQLQAQPHSAIRNLALEISQQHLNLLANRDFSRLRKLTGQDDHALKAAQQLIASLNPYPAAGFGGEETRYVAADIVVQKQGAAWVARLNSAAMPRLRVNSLYANLLKQQRESGNALNGQLQEARWLVRNIRQRFDTILRVAEAIVIRQQAFFEHGEEAMLPLVLREIAEELGLHESTISRVTSQKFLLCPRGLFELKYFFGSGLETDSGESCSATAIKARLKKLIQAEDPKKPLSDNTLAELLSREGIQVARRTVAKYREALHLPPANQRKAL